MGGQSPETDQDQTDGGHMGFDEKEVALNVKALHSLLTGIQVEFQEHLFCLLSFDFFLLCEPSFLA